MHLFGYNRLELSLAVYMWFLIAGEQITQAKNHLNHSMTMEQLLEAEQRAAKWIRKMRKIYPRRSKILLNNDPRGRRTHLPPDLEEEVGVEDCTLKERRQFDPT
jgi:hypothetical protein